MAPGMMLQDTDDATIDTRTVDNKLSLCLEASSIFGKAEQHGESRIHHWGKLNHWQCHS